MDKEEKWREEFEASLDIHPDHPMDENAIYKRNKMNLNNNGEYSWGDTRREWKVYLEACKKRDAEIEELKIDLVKLQAELVELRTSPYALDTITRLEKEIIEKDEEVDSWKKLYEENLNKAVAEIQMTLDVLGDNKKLRYELAEKDKAIKKAVEYIEIADYGHDCSSEFYQEIADFIEKYGEK